MSHLAAHGKLTPRLSRLTVQRARSGPGRVLERLQMVAVRDRTVITAVVDRLFSNAATNTMTAAGAPTWTRTAIERWLWTLLVQRCEATAAVAAADRRLAGLVGPVAALRLSLVLPTAWQPSALQKRTWTTLLHRFGTHVRQASRRLEPQRGDKGRVGADRCDAMCQGSTVIACAGWTGSRTSPALSLLPGRRTGRAHWPRQSRGCPCGCGHAASPR